MSNPNSIDLIKAQWEKANDDYNVICDALVLVKSRIWNIAPFVSELYVSEQANLEQAADDMKYKIDSLYNLLKASYR